MVFKKGMIPWNKNRKETRLEVLARQSEVRKGKYNHGLFKKNHITPLERRLKISNTLKEGYKSGRILAPRGMLGKVPWNKDKKLNYKTNGSFKKGRIPWNKNRKETRPEVLKRASEVRKNIKYSDISKQKRSIALKKAYQNGIRKPIKITPEHRLSMVTALRAKGPWNKNKTYEESYGLDKSNLIKKRLSIISKREENVKRLKEIRKYQVIPKKDTKIEVKIQNYLKELGYEFFTHKYIKEIEHGYQCDVFIPAMNLVIECDGNYWHAYPTGREIDHIRTKELLDKGFKVLRLWEFEINKMNLEEFKKRLIL